jgi:ADP-ribose pyrophosphatase YjhB (NUDIX family)
MTPRDFFRHCPRCGARQLAPPATNVFTCGACGFRLFFNPAVAIAVFIQRADGQALFIHRAKDPGRGCLAPPGGFIDLGERAETAAGREIREEVGLEIADVTFLGSHPNSYHYAEVTYPVLDFFFTARALNAEQAAALDDVAQFEWLDPLSVRPEQLAFPSMQAALDQWQEQLRRAGVAPAQ